jgi:hypothetical protein
MRRREFISSSLFRGHIVQRIAATDTGQSWANL